MSDRRNGLYYESKDIRNSVLLRNIGEYTGYKYSMLYNGGLAIGMPYAVETEFVPYTLAEKSIPGLQVTVSPGQINASGKKENPNINLAWKEGGLFGYTHEVLNNEYDWLSRNVNIPESYYDYNSTEDLMVKLDRFPNSLPWGQSTDVIGGIESGGLRAFSSHNDPQNSVFYNDYTDYVRDIFTNGVSFDKQLGEHYATNLLYDGFSKDTVDTGVAGFIDERSGFIIDDVDEYLKPIEDTKLAYIGRIMLGEEKDKQIKNVERVGKELYITNTLGLYYGLSSASLPTLKQEMLGGAGVSYDFDMADSLLGGDSRFIVELDKSYDDEVLDNENTDDDETYLGYSVSNPQMRYLRDVHKRARRSQSFYRDGINDKYVEYYNIFDNTVHFDWNEDGGIDSDEESYAVSVSNNTKDLLGYSVEGFFRGAGVFDGTVSQNEHYDERDTQFAGQRDIVSKKISYDSFEYIGVDSNSGLSNRQSSLLEKTKVLFDSHKIKTLVGRFHTSNDDRNAKATSALQTATDPTYGISHGRNLLKLNPTYENGYDNPYCRVWTYHHQYAKMTDLIRPFTDGENFMSIDGMQAAYPGRPILRNGGRQSWAEKTVLNKNGMVNIAPTRKIGDGDKNRVKAKQCMFSIENLAWKSVNRSTSNIDAGEIGPLGGRIMWFPPYNLQFNESVSVTWGGNDFIGRGERIYSYTNTERSGSLSFTILADHPSILDYWMNSDNRRGKPGTEEDQQKVLRFFAGCENLEAEEQVADKKNGTKTDYYAKKENQKNKPENPQDNTDPIPEENKKETPATMPTDEFTKDNSIGFYVFFPNNLSGIDFVKNPKAIVNYLVNGRNGFEFNPNLDGNEEHHILPSESTVIGDWSDNVMMLTPSDGPGYEMGRSNNTGLTDNETRTYVSKYNTAHDSGRDYLWGYGIDKDKVKERLCGPHGAKGDKSYKLYVPNYYDSTDYKLNVTPGDDACKYSFADVAVALTTDYKYSGKGEVAENVDEIKKILGIGSEVKQQGRKYYFAIAGGASVHGYVDRNTGLSKRRASFLRSWLEDCFKKLNLQVDYDESVKIPTFTEIAGGEEDLYINSRGAKRGRYAKAVIYWNDEDVKDATKANSEYTPGAKPPKGIISMQESTTPNESENQDTVAESTTYLNSVALHDFSSTRYRDEEKFFDMLKESDPVIYKNIVDKVKYFDPIYHSITPEGFNARLAFLHQCTRQGPTISSSDLSQNNGFNGAGYAGNLSFGRAPVCVLRLGDFFNTRIIINSLNIQYEQPQWDLNPEGIGVQPMLANVTISFVFQGGSSLGGPIQRLQNAVSFNYYANQEVYDDRADVAVYKSADETGGTGELDMDASMIWMPGYGNVNLGKITTAIDIMKDPKKITQDNLTKVNVEREKAISDLEAKKWKEMIEKYSTEVDEEEVDEEPIPTGN